MLDADEQLYNAFSSDKAKRKPKPALDASGTEAVGFTGEEAELQRLDEETVSAIHAWLETDDLDDDETLADRLFALFVGIFDVNKNGELDEDENQILDIALNCAWEYLTQKGVSEEDAGALLNDWDGDAATRVFDLLVSALPDGEEAVDADIDNFVWGDDQEPMLDAAYKKVFAIRHGKKVRINKRISGTVRLSSKQKVAIRRLHAKPITARSRLRRMKSMRLSRKMGLSG